MATSRAVAGRPVTSCSPIMIRPAVGSSSPAIMRKVVVLPQPEGPNRVTRWPALDRERYLAHGHDLAERLGHPLEADGRRGTHAGCPATRAGAARRPSRRSPTASWNRPITASMTRIRTEQ